MGASPGPLRVLLRWTEFVDLNLHLISLGKASRSHYPTIRITRTNSYRWRSVEKLEVVEEDYVVWLSSDYRSVLLLKFCWILVGPQSHELCLTTTNVSMPVGIVCVPIHVWTAHIDL